MPNDRQFRVVDNFALASDGVQWIVQRRKGSQWQAVSFVRSTKITLARCIAESGAPNDVAERLLAGLPDDFDTWRDGMATAGHPRSGRSGKTAAIPAGSPLATLPERLPVALPLIRSAVLTAKTGALTWRLAFE